MPNRSDIIAFQGECGHWLLRRGEVTIGCSEPFADLANTSQIEWLATSLSFLKLK